ncbi:MAG: hypothetical protein EWM73_01036 [Nitrospira sp.]|nr:MAG: hypothetical protein EWM73_01036 [Nitrospira sp.]
MRGIGEVLRGHVGLITGDVGAYETRLIAAGRGMDKIHDIPAIFFREFIGPVRHARTGNTVGQPAEKIPCGMQGGVRLREQIHRWLRESLGLNAIAHGLGSVAGHAVRGKQDCTIGNGNGIERDRRLAVGFRISRNGKGRQRRNQRTDRQYRRDGNAPLRSPTLGPTECDRSTCQD